MDHHTIKINKLASYLTFSFVLAFFANIFISFNKHSSPDRSISITVHNSIIEDRFVEKREAENEEINNPVKLQGDKYFTNDKKLNITYNILEFTEENVPDIEETEYLPECKPVLSKELIDYSFDKIISWPMVSQKFSRIIHRSSYQLFISRNQSSNFLLMPSNYSFYHPTTCVASQCVAILIPARNRDKHLRHLLYHLPKILVNQLSCFGIYVLDQYDEQTTFNKAKLFNSGVLEAKKDKPWDCFVFHDVDLLLKNQSILYKCESDGNPLHLSVAIDKYNYRLFNWYETTVGGVSLFDWRAIEMINGWSNEFWGWGGEDDNMYSRVVEAGLQLARPEFKCENPKTLNRRNKLRTRNKHFGTFGDPYRVISDR